MEKLLIFDENISLTMKIFITWHIYQFTCKEYGLKGSGVKKNQCLRKGTVIAYVYTVTININESYSQETVGCKNYFIVDIKGKGGYDKSGAAAETKGDIKNLHVTKIENLVLQKYI